MTPEIPKSGGARSGDDSEGIWQERKSQLLLQVHQALFLQPCQSQPLEFLAGAEGEIRVHIINIQRQSEDRVVIDLSLEKDFHPDGEGGPGDTPEVLIHEVPP